MNELYPFECNGSVLYRVHPKKLPLDFVGGLTLDFFGADSPREKPFVLTAT